MEKYHLTKLNKKVLDLNVAEMTATSPQTLMSVGGSAYQASSLMPTTLTAEDSTIAGNDRLGANRGTSTMQQQ